MDVTLQLFIVALLMGLGAWCFFIWGIGEGQFRNIEEASRRMLDNDRRE